MRPLSLTLLLGLFSLLTVAPLEAGPAPDPEDARFITEDIPRFWQAWDAAGGPPDAARLAHHYLGQASPGLADFLALRIGDAARLARTIGGAQAYYAAIRPATLSVPTHVPAMRAAFRRLEAQLPEAVFPDVYFVIGRMNSGGTLSERALLIGVEMYGRGPGVPLDGLSAWHQAVIGPSAGLPHIVAHELVHYQQAAAGARPTLLEASLREGVADFIAERISGAHINATAHAWGLARECALWREFGPRRGGTDYQGFLYDGDAADGRPADLGYFIGYRIAAAYHARADEPTAALRDLLGARPAEAVLAASGYAPCGPGPGAGVY